MTPKTKSSELESIKVNNQVDRSGVGLPSSSASNFWDAEIKALKAINPESKEQAIRIIAESVIKKLNLPYSQSLVEQISGSLEDDQAIGDILQQELKLL